MAETFISDHTALTPIQKRGDVWVKREDLFRFGGVRGSKARVIKLIGSGARGLITAGHRSATLVEIVPQIAKAKGVPCRVHIPFGEETRQMKEAVAHGATLVRHRPGYRGVIFRRAKDDAARRGWTLVPFGVESPVTVELTAKQVRAIPPGVKRIVTAVGSGMALSGILTGLEAIGRDIPVLGVMAGADPRPILDKYAPKDWRKRVSLRASGFPYGHEVEADIGGIILDPVYEAKAKRFLRPGDLMWIVSVRSSAYSAEKALASLEGWPADLAL